MDHLKHAVEGPISPVPANNQTLDNGPWRQIFCENNTILLYDLEKLSFHPCLCLLHG